MIKFDKFVKHSLVIEDIRPGVQHQLIAAAELLEGSDMLKIRTGRDLAQVWNFHIESWRELNAAVEDLISKANGGANGR